MTACDRFETEGLERFAAGEPLDAHFTSCADCRAAQARYEMVVRALGVAGRACAPPGDWEARVFARIQRRRPRRRLWFAAAAALPVAGLAVFTFQSMGGAQSLELEWSVSRGAGPVVRGGGPGAGQAVSAAPGDVLHLTARVPRGRHGDLRVYRGGDTLVFQCAGNPRCSASRDGLSAEVVLEAGGTYRTLVLAAERDLPPPTGKLDADYAAALRAGEAQESPPIEVL